MTVYVSERIVLISDSRLILNWTNEETQTTKHHNSITNSTSSQANFYAEKRTVYCLHHEYLRFIFNI